VILFILLASGSIALALMFVLPSLLDWQHKSVPPTNTGNQQINRKVFQRQLAELEQDHANGTLDKDQYDAARQDLERALINDTKNPLALQPIQSGRWAIPVFAFGIPIFAIGLYLFVGDYQAISRSQATKTLDQPNLAKMRDLVDQLEAKMYANPKNLKGWLMLGRSALVLGQTERALNAYAQAKILAPKEPEVLITYANAVARVTGKFAGQPIKLIQETLVINPEHKQALWLMGLAELERGNKVKALEYWTHLETKFEPNSQEANSLHRLIMKTRQGLLNFPESNQP